MRTNQIRLTIVVLIGLGLIGGILDRGAAAEAVVTKPTLSQPPTKAPIEPTTAPPVKSPIPPTEVLPTKTPWPTVVATKTIWPTALPTATPLPTDTPPTVTDASYSTPSASTPLPRATGAVGSPAISPASAAGNSPTIALSGSVFEDRNGNGVQDADEPGLAGIPVIVKSGDRQQTLITDANGAYTAQVDTCLTGHPCATVQVVPPSGWSAVQLAAVPLEPCNPLSKCRAYDFALVRSASAPVGTVTTLTQTVLDLAPLVTLGGLLAAVLAFGLIQIGRTVSASNRQLALTLVRLQRTSEQPITFDATATSDRAHDPKVLALLNQASLDAADCSLHIEHVLKVMVDPAAAIIALGRDRQQAAFVVFTPLTAKAFQAALRPGEELSVEAVFERAAHYPLERLGEALAGGRAYVVDAISSGLFIADDLASVFQYLASDLPVATRTLPRAGRWHLLVGPTPRSTLKVQTGRRGRLRQALISLTRNLRKDFS